MGSALIRGFLNSSLVSKNSIIASDLDSKKLKRLKEETGIRVTSNNCELVKKSDIVFIAVEPKAVAYVLGEIKKFADKKLIVSIAAGISTKFIEKRLKNSRVVRIMPNAPATVQQMAAGYCLGKKAIKKDAEIIEKLLNSIGVAYLVKERYIDTVTAISGSGPTYFYMIIDALTSTGIKAGLSRDIALKLAAQTAKGAGEMILKTGKSPQELINMVCTPGGITIEAIKVLKKEKVEDSFKKAVKAAIKRSKELSR